MSKGIRWNDFLFISLLRASSASLSRSWLQIFAQILFVVIAVTRTICIHLHAQYDCRCPLRGKWPINRTFIISLWYRSAKWRSKAPNSLICTDQGYDHGEWLTVRPSNADNVYRRQYLLWLINHLATACMQHKAAIGNKSYRLRGFIAMYSGAHTAQRPISWMNLVCLRVARDRQTA